MDWLLPSMPLHLPPLLRPIQGTLKPEEPGSGLRGRKTGGSFFFCHMKRKQTPLSYPLNLLKSPQEKNNLSQKSKDQKVNMTPPPKRLTCGSLGQSLIETVSTK